jgi:hypothetical protein
VAARTRILAVTVERTAEGIRARAWAASAVARIWRPAEEDLLASEDALVRWVASLDTRHGPGIPVLVAADTRQDAPLLDAIKRGMKT